MTKRLNCIKEQVAGQAASADDPLSWQLTEAEQLVWDAFPAFCVKHPLRLDSLGLGLQLEDWRAP